METRAIDWNPHQMEDILEATHSSALPMAASSNPKRDYHVFLSFRGTDVRNNFLSHLHAALDQQGIHTFVDREELRKGEEISPALMRAIEGSRVAIILFSKDYASSPWCLEEVGKIMECKERNGLIVFPMFYKVEPREVRGIRKSYGRAMAEHESKFGKDSEKVKRWKQALSDAGSLSGWTLDDRDEAELIQCIVKDLSIHLDRTPLHVAKYPVGIDSRVEKLISLLQEESDYDDVLMIGLWGPGGIGKTTIAKALFNAIQRQFQGSSFLTQVRETSNHREGLVALQEQLLSEILPHKTLTVNSVDGGISLIRERLCCKKVLLVLDDVDQLYQLNALAGQGNWFGKGSRIVITSRDEHVLNSHGINLVVEVPTLRHDEALYLFGRHAFPDSNGVEIRSDLISRALHYANGLPLALEVLGSFLRGRDEPAWESTLHKLIKSPERTVNQVLKTSFDGLEDNEREIFLDIACFFKGKTIEYIKEVVDSCGLDATIGVDILVERSLIKNENGTLQMHDLIQLMGKDIVNQECPDDPGKRSRIWVLEDVMDILCEDMGTNAVKAIVLELPAPEEITISPNAFAKMKKLRVLILREVHISSQGPVRLPRELRLLEWPNAPDLEFGPGLKQLVRLDIQKSQIRQLGGNFENFRNLKSINFSECKSLASVPNLSSVPNLESLDLHGCQSLVEVHQSIGYLDKLKILSLQWCSSLRIFPETLKTKSLQSLNLSGCSKLEKFSDIGEKMEHLEDLRLGGTAIKDLPASIENLVSMKRIMLLNCKNLAGLPSSIYKLKNLEVLDLHGCSNFVMFPNKLGDSTDLDGDMEFPNLLWLLLDGCNLSVEFLDSCSSFPRLVYLNLLNNKFTHLPTCIKNYDCWKDKFVRQRTNGSGNWHLHSSVSSTELFERVATVNILLRGREMPEWIIPCNKDFYYFLFPMDLHVEYLGLTLCLVIGPEEGKVLHLAKYTVCLITGIGWKIASKAKDVSPLESDHLWLIHFPRDTLAREVVDGWSTLRFEHDLPEGSIKKCGFRPIYEQQEDDLKVPALHFQSKRIISLKRKISDIEPKQRIRSTKGTFFRFLEEGESVEDSSITVEDSSINTQEVDSPAKQRLT